MSPLELYFIQHDHLNWVQRLMRQNGLDATDLEAVFARVARQEVQQQMPVMESSEANLQS
jgi:hypothetical protein